jgi:hypothetical protein
MVGLLTRYNQSQDPLAIIVSPYLLQSKRVECRPAFGAIWFAALQTNLQSKRGKT